MKLMSQHKAQGGAIAVIIILSLILIGAGLLIFFLSRSGNFGSKEIEKNQTSFKLILNTIDSETGELVKSNYILKNISGTEISSGIIEEGERRDISAKPLQYEINCWSDEYYLTKGFKSFSQIDIDLGVGSVSCPMSKIEKNLQVKVEGEISGEISQINLNLTAKDRFQRAVICSAWTSGFISVDVQNSFSECGTGVWKNYTSFNASSNTYDYLPEEEYICGKRVETCQTVLGTQCKVENEKIPLRLKTKVDNCFYLGKSIDKQSISVPITIKKGEFTTRNDAVTFYILDKDRRFDSTENRYLYFTEYNNLNLGADDVIITIPFTP